MCRFDEVCMYCNRLSYCEFCEICENCGDTSRYSVAGGDGDNYGKGGAAAGRDVVKTKNYHYNKAAPQHVNAGAMVYQDENSFGFCGQVKNLQPGQTVSFNYLPKDKSYSIGLTDHRRQPPPSSNRQPGNSGRSKPAILPPPSYRPN